MLYAAGERRGNANFLLTIKIFSWLSSAMRRLLRRVAHAHGICGVPRADFYRIAKSPVFIRVFVVPVSQRAIAHTGRVALPVESNCD